MFVIKTGKTASVRVKHNTQKVVFNSCSSHANRYWLVGSSGWQAGTAHVKDFLAKSNSQRRIIIDLHTRFVQLKARKSEFNSVLFIFGLRSGHQRLAGFVHCRMERASFFLTWFQFAVS